MQTRSEEDLQKLIQGGETNTVELKVAAPRATEMAERLCGMVNAQGGIIIIGVQDATYDIRHAARYKDRERVLVGMRCAVVTDDKWNAWAVGFALCWMRRSVLVCLSQSFVR